MIEIKPNINISVHCKACESEAVDVQSLFFQGIHTLAVCNCQNCGFDFYWTLPIGHDLLFPIQVSKDNRRAFFAPRAQWLAAPLIRSMKAGEGQRVDVSIKTKKQVGDIVIVNCLDSCFGHVFTKIWNAYTLIENHSDLGVVVLIPENMEWLLPDDIAEAWVVPLPLKVLDHKLDGLDTFVHQQLERFNRVQLSHTYTHLDQHRYIDIAAMLKTPRFDLDHFATPPVITFVLREDRFWHNSKTMDLLYKAGIKGGFTAYTKKLLVKRQIRLINKTAQLILKALPNARLVATGLGKTGMLDKNINDQRVVKIDLDTEQEWNATYAKSHLVIGIHGSNMLIPTGLAAGFINILPRHKLEHLNEDTALPYTNRFLSFLGRNLDEYSSPQLVALHAVSMIRDFPYQYHNTVQVPE